MSAHDKAVYVILYTLPVAILGVTLLWYMWTRRPK